MDGILLVDKPQGFTSHDIVDFIRKRYKIKRVGHGGALDPQATGVLVILLGRATRFFSSIIELEKEYLGTFYLGKSTDTGDGMGNVILEERDEEKIRKIKPEEIEKAFFNLTGEIYLTPPMFSALRYKGKRLYELARKGKTVERLPRLVKIHLFKLLKFAPPFVDFHILCSRGTYIRSLCEELMKELKIPLYLHSLRRLRCGNFFLEDSLSIDSLKKISFLEEFVIPIPKILSEGYLWSK